MIANKTEPASHSLAAGSEKFEASSIYGATDEERLRLVRTIVAMANTQGGEIRIFAIRSGQRHLDAAALESSVNKYVGPSIHGLKAEQSSDGSTCIRVPESEDKPHIFRENGRYKDEEDNIKHTFYRGQIWVRHSSGNSEAFPDDLRSLLYDAAGRLLERVGSRIRQPGFVLSPEDGSAISVRLGNDPDALLVRADLDVTYPHTRQSFTVEFDREYSWIVAATRILALEESPEYAYTDRNSVGHPTHWRYSEAAHEKLRAQVAENPEWDPREL